MSDKEPKSEGSPGSNDFSQILEQSLHGLEQEANELDAQRLRQGKVKLTRKHGQMIPVEPDKFYSVDEGRVSVMAKTLTAEGPKESTLHVVGVGSLLNGGALVDGAVVGGARLNGGQIESGRYYVAMTEVTLTVWDPGFIKRQFQEKPTRYTGKLIELAVQLYRLIVSLVVMVSDLREQLQQQTERAQKAIADRLNFEGQVVALRRTRNVLQTKVKQLELANQNLTAQLNIPVAFPRPAALPTHLAEPDADIDLDLGVGFEATTLAATATPVRKHPPALPRPEPDDSDDTLIGIQPSGVQALMQLRASVATPAPDTVRRVPPRPAPPPLPKRVERRTMTPIGMQVPPLVDAPQPKLPVIELEKHQIQAPAPQPTPPRRASRETAEWGFAKDLGTAPKTPTT